MFWKKKEAKIEKQTQKEEPASDVGKVMAQMEQTAAHKTMSDRERALAERENWVNRLTNEIEQLTPGQRLVYKLPEFFWTSWGAFQIAQLNPDYPEKDKKKYIAYGDKMADGKPAGQKINVWKSNKAMDIANWIADSNYQGTIERIQE